MSTAKPTYTAVSVTLAARDALRDLAVVGTTVTQVRISMSAAARAALIHARQDPDGFRAAMEAIDDESED